MINIESAGRRKGGSLYVKAAHHTLTQSRSGALCRAYHERNKLGSLYGNRALSDPWLQCCEEFEKQALIELSGLQLLDDMMRDLEE